MKFSDQNQVINLRDNYVYEHTQLGLFMQVYFKTFTLPQSAI